MDVGCWAASDVVIVAAQRTPIGSLNGNLSSHKASSLGTIVIESLLKKSNVSHAEVSEVILGQALTAGNFLLINVEYTIMFHDSNCESALKLRSRTKCLALNKFCAIEKIFTTACCTQYNTACFCKLQKEVKGLTRVR